MSVAALVSLKGGVGKTTLALNLGLSFAQRGYRTLLVDADPQGGLGQSLVGRARGERGLVECARRLATLSEASLPTREPGLDLLAFGRAPAQPWRWAAGGDEALGLGATLAEAGRRYEVVLVDTASGLPPSSLSALRAASHVIAPVAAEPLGLRSAAPLVDLLGQLRDEGGARLAAAVLTMVRLRDQVSMQSALEAWHLFPAGLMLEAHLPWDRTLLRASALGVPAAYLHRRPPAAAAVFQRLAAELEPRLDLHEPNEDPDEVARPLLD